MNKQASKGVLTYRQGKQTKHSFGMSNCNFTTSRQAGRQANTNRRKLVQNKGTKQDTKKDKENKEKQGRINGQKKQKATKTD